MSYSHVFPSTGAKNAVVSQPQLDKENVAVKSGDCFVNFRSSKSDEQLASPMIYTIRETAVKTRTCEAKW